MIFLRRILIMTVIATLVLITAQIALRNFTQSENIGGHTLNQDPVRIAIADLVFEIPKNVLRFAKEREGGTLRQIHLYFHWPTFAGYTEETAPAFTNANSSGDLLFVTLSQEADLGPPDKRLEEIYRRFFVDKPWRGPSGLIGQRLDPASGYQGETVYYGRSGDTLFVTRCLSQQSASEAGVMPTCLFDFKIGDEITALVRFDAEKLSDWQTISSGLKRTFASYIAT